MQCNNLGTFFLGLANLFPCQTQEELNISHMGPWNRQEFMKEWRRTHRAATLLDPVVVEAAPDSLDALMAEMGAALASYDGRLDMEAVAVKMMAMVCGVINLSNLVPVPRVLRYGLFTNLPLNFVKLASCPACYHLSSSK